MTLHYSILAAAAASLLSGCALKLGGTLEGDAASDPLGDDARLDVIVEPTGDGQCPDGLTDCGGLCVDTNTDNNHCGGCNHACITPQLCNGAGVCAAQCSPPYTLCSPGPDAYCADLTSDPANCGECGMGCDPGLHARPTCTGGVCGLECESGFVDLDGDGGCECSVTGSEACDGIDNDCDGSIDNGFPCPLGSSPESCTDPTTSCDGQKICQADCTWSDCGSGAWQCIPGATQSCPEGCGMSQTCTGSCSWGPCEGEGCPGATPDCCSGTCTSILTDPLNCGVCGSPCGTGTMCCNGSCAACCGSSDCADTDPCTADTCDAGTCNHTRVGDMGACAGGDGTPGVCCSGVCNPGGNCCVSADCGSTTGSCIGTPPLCSSASDSSSCSRIRECSWDGWRHVCQGTPITCGGMADYCSSLCLCTWNTGTGMCSGTGNCSSIDYFDSRCTRCGCDWGLFDGCHGSAACSSMSCSSQPGCSWSTSSGSCSDHHCQ